MWTSAGSRVSGDPVAAPLFYREVELPFAKANRNLTKIRWRFGIYCTDWVTRPMDCISASELMRSLIALGIFGIQMNLSD